MLLNEPESFVTKCESVYIFSDEMANFSDG